MAMRGRCRRTVVIDLRRLADDTAQAAGADHASLFATPTA
jgi:hypothetical protein